MIKFPKTPHLPLHPSAATDDDIIANEEEMNVLYTADVVVVQEKLDGANLRVQFDGKNEPMVGNREHILKKGYVKKDTPAKLQFRPVWNWLYENREPFAKLAGMLGGVPVVFGEWMWAQHTTKYDLLPSYFFAYDVFIDNIFLNPMDTVWYLTASGFHVPPLLNMGSAEELNNLLYERSLFSSTDLREGLYFKAGNKDETTHRFKLLRPDYKTVADFTERGLIKNRLV